MATIFDEPAVQPKKSHGCLFGCLIAAGIGFGLLLCAGVGSYFFVKSQIAKYTSDKPAELPKVEYTDDQMVELETRMQSFKAAVDEGAEEETELVLTADDINALISKNKDLRDKAFIKIESGKVSGDLSLPLDGIPMGSGRYFNGSAGFNVSMEDGVLVVTLADAEVNGTPVPQHVIDKMAEENLAQDAYKNPANAQTLRRFKSISVEDDKIILKLRPKEESSEEEATSSTDSDDLSSTEPTTLEPTPVVEPTPDVEPVEP